MRLNLFCFLIQVVGSLTFLRLVTIVYSTINRFAEMLSFRLDRFKCKRHFSE